MTRLPIVLLALLLVAGTAVATVDAEISIKAKVKSTIQPAAEVETYRFDALEGTEISIKVAVKDGDLRDPRFDLEDPFARDMDLAGIAVLRSDEASVKGLVLQWTGSYVLRVRGTGVGEIQLKLKGKPREKWTDTVSLGGNDLESVSFAAAAGSKVKLVAKTAKKSDTEPRFGDFEGQDLSNEGKIKPTSHKVTVEDVDGGEIAVGLQNLAAVGGEIVVKITVSPPDIEKDKLDFRGETLGMPDGGETVTSRTIEAAAGGTIQIDDAQSEIDGTVLEVPVGAVAEDTRFSISSGQAIEPIGDTWQMVGPTVEIGPSGVLLPQPVRVTIPYDPTMPSAGEVPVGVYRVDEDEDWSFVPAVEVDTFAHTVTFETQRFSRFRANARRGAPQLKDRSYWNLFFEMVCDSSSPPDMPRREFLVGMGSVTLGDPGIPNSWVYEGVEHWFAFEQDDNAQEYHDDTTGTIQPMITGTTGSGSSPLSGSGSWSYMPGGQHVRAQLSIDDAIVYVMSQDGSILLATGESDPTDPSTLLEVCLEKPTVKPTAAALAGKYTLAMIEVSAQMNPNSPTNIELGRSFGTLTLGSDGTVSIKLDDRFEEYDPGDAAWDASKESFSGPGTFTIAGSADGVFEGTIVTTFEDDGDTDRARLFPSKDLSVLVGTDRDPCGCALLIVAIRQGSGMKRSKLDGDWFDIIVEARPRVESVRFFQEDAQNQVIEEHYRSFGDLGLVEETATFRFDGSSTMTVPGTVWREIHRDVTEPTGVVVETGHDSDVHSTSVSVASNGKVTISGNEFDPLLGAVDPGYRFMFLVVDPDENDPGIGLDLVLKPPPRNP